MLLHFSLFIEREHMRIKTGTRMIQTYKNRKEHKFTVYNNQLPEEIEINLRGAEILENIYKNGDDYIWKLTKNKEYNEYIKQLQDIGFLNEETTDNNVYLAKRCSYKYPLTALSIELTDLCNLRCKHCYGGYSKSQKGLFISDEKLINVMNELDELHTKKIALTGGEATMHPRFIDIAMRFLQKGFDVTVLTNGYNEKIIKAFLEKSQNYKYTIKVSLDGTGEIHNLIRGRDDVYNRVCNTLNEIIKYSNVTLYISTVIMKDNVEYIEMIEEYVKSNFPTAIHTFDFVFPAGNAIDSCALSLEEVRAVIRKYSKLFMTNNVDVSERKNVRCTAGITQCTLACDGSLRICNSACDKQFVFKYNAFEKGLKYAWIHCGRNIYKFRNEKAHRTKDCKKCVNEKFCKKKDCRVLAYVYRGDAKRSNPLVCCETEEICRLQKLN